MTRLYSPLLFRHPRLSVALPVFGEVLKPENQCGNSNASVAGSGHTRTPWELLDDGCRRWSVLV
jgi:hypothetical protein